MEERASLLICLGAATAANCVPCFEHYHNKASAAGLSSKEILEAVELAAKVKSGAHMVIRNRIKSLLDQETPATACGCSPAEVACCG
jgi:alkylhydroperoxidase/carboxymuconolactone decarboxylase family protein YurZ